MKRILVVLLSMLLMSSVCFAEENDNTLNAKEQYAYDCVDQIIFNEPDSVRFRSVNGPFGENLYVIVVSFRNQLGGTSMQMMFYRDKRLQDVIETDAYDPCDPDVDLKKLNRVWRINHQDE